MKKSALIILSLLVVSGCAANGQPRVDKSLAAALSCNDKIKLTVSNFSYSESHMNMIAISDVGPESGFLIRLMPRDGFDDAEVTVTGTSPNSGWILGNGKANSLSNRLLFVGCAPDDPENTKYKFEVKVEKGEVTNILDPRARLIR